MKDILEEQLTKVEDRFILIDGILLLSDEESTYELEYEYLRGKRDVLIYLLSICIEEEDEYNEDYPCDIYNDF